jgi:hypothetical protein
LVAAFKCWYCPVAHALHALNGSGAAFPAAQFEHGAVDDTKAVPAAQ